MRSIIVLISSLITLPIVIYLQYQILERVNASELMWFLFWVNVPLMFLMTAVGKLIDGHKD